jgi:methyl-accepting chemotaxis protein
MKNWTIGKRLATGFATVIGIVLCLGAIMWLNTGTVSRSVTSIVGEDIPKINTLADIRFQVTWLRVINLKHAVYAEAAQKAEAEKDAQAGEKRLEELVAQCEKQLKQEEERALFAKVPPLLEAYLAETRKLRDASAQNKTAETQALLQSAGKIGNDFVATVESLNEKAAGAVAAAGHDTTSLLNRSKLTLLAAEVLAVLASLAIVFVISRSISSVLRRTITEMLAGAEQTASAAGQVSSASQSLAEGASEQAASLEETSSSLEEMASMTKRNAENAEKANQLARHARQAADTGATDMQAMNSAMEAIKVSSDDIAKIIKTIDEIAFQTNILALNAAVEAARAGEAGMGFAVVADEVRSLAQRCAQSAKETSAKIEAAITKAAQGVEISAKVTRGLQEIVTKARQVDELVGEVASASKEQSQGIDQVNTAVGQMDKVTQTNAANAEESASASEELNAQAESLKDAVHQLQTLVGGVSAENSRETSQSRPSSKGASRETKNHRTFANRVTRSSTPDATAASRGSGADSQPAGSTDLAAASKSRNAELIPMAGDFKDF